MKQFILVVCVVFSLNGFSQIKCDMQNHYGDFIKLTKKNSTNDEYLSQDVVKVDSQYCFADYVNNNLRHIEYLIWHFCPNYSFCKDSLKKIKDSLALQSAFNAVMQEDSLFNAVMLELTTKVIDKTVPKDTITMEKLLNIAVKYFYVPKITEQGYYVGKVCSMINGIKETEQERKPFLEAFSWVSISKHYYGKEYNMQDELASAIKELYKLNLGVDEKERLLRARGAVFMQMFYNKKLRDMLLYEYENKKEYLPFVLSDM
jgi:hypothetical protein